MSLANMDTGAAIRKAFVDDGRMNDTFLNRDTNDIQVWQAFPSSGAIHFPVAIYTQNEVEPGEDADGRASLYVREKWTISIYQLEDPEGLVSIIIGAFDPTTSGRTGGVIDAIGELIGGTFVYTGQTVTTSPDNETVVTTLTFRASRLQQ